MKNTKKVKGMKHGIYEIYWASGGSSLASVGYDSQGYNWLSPCNWISGHTLSWDEVKAVKLIVANDYSQKTKKIPSLYGKIDFIKENFKIEE